MDERLTTLRSLVAQPVPDTDPEPGRIGDCVFVGNKYHAKDVALLVRLNITAVLNCASSGIRNLPLDGYAENGIDYNYTNVAQDAHNYPILHDRHGVTSDHLETAQTVYERVRNSRSTGRQCNLMFFCVAGQNRSATLAVAVQVAAGIPLDDVLRVCSKSRPFILENVGFQKQLIELEAKVKGEATSGPSTLMPPDGKREFSNAYGSIDGKAPKTNDPSKELVLELTVPGLRTFDVVVPKESTPAELKEVLLKPVDEHLRRRSESSVHAGGGGARKVGKSFLVFSSFTHGAEYNLILEPEAVEMGPILARLSSTFGLKLIGEPEVRPDDCKVVWDFTCRFELIIFSTVHPDDPNGPHEVFKFRHQERAGAPGTYLSEEDDDVETYLRAWDFVTGEAYRSIEPIVFSFSDDAKSKRDFMNISTSREGERQQFNAPGEGGILGMGANAIVHHVQLKAALPEEKGDTGSQYLSVLQGQHGAVSHQSSGSSQASMPGVPRLLRRQSIDSISWSRTWDAACKRQFSLPKMLAAMENKAEVGVAKRLRMAGALNRQGRLLYFYGLGITLASNNDIDGEYKFEVTLLSQFQEDFSAYTLKSFMDDYIKSSIASTLKTLSAHESRTFSSTSRLSKSRCCSSRCWTAFAT